MRHSYLKTTLYHGYIFFPTESSNLKNSLVAIKIFPG